MKTFRAINWRRKELDCAALIGSSPGMAKTVLFASLAAVSGLALAQRGDGKGDERWNITGPSWYDTPCHVGFSGTHGLPSSNWRKPCSVPIRVCEYKTMTMSYPAEPDVPCEQMAKPGGVGELVRSYVKRWD
jgi:hypothetical protein